MHNMTQQRFVEPARELEVLDDADVVVVGGGAGGIGAAISAARSGCKTILIERFGALGGTWTTGLMSMIMVNWSARGIFEEYRRKLDERGSWKPVCESWAYWGGDNPPEEEASYEGCYDAETAKMVLDEMAADAGVRIYYFAQLVHVFKNADGKRVTGIAIQSKEGRHVITGKIFVDSSGDGDLGALAGAKFEFGRSGDGRLQPATMMFTMVNVDSERAEAYMEGDDCCVKAWRAAKARGEVTVERENLVIHPSGKPGQWVFNCARSHGLDGTKLADVSNGMTEGRRQATEIANFMKKHIPGFENARLAETAAHIGVRETRRFKCDYTITGDDVQLCKKHPDVIARGNWPVDIHSPTDMTAQVKPIRNGAYYEIPYRSVTVAGLDNLLVASRCLDATHEGHAGVRASPQICAVGQAVGAAAAQAVKQNLATVRQIDVSELQRQIRAGGGLV